MMNANEWKVAWRNLLKNKGYSAINIGGLALGMAVALLIGLWVNEQLSYNKAYPAYDRIGQIMQHATFNGKVESQISVPGVMADELRTKYGENFKHVVQSSWRGDHLFSVGTKHLTKSTLFFEPGVTEMLALKMLSGTRSGLNDPYTVLLSASTAKAFFGDKEALNQTLRLDREHDVKVTGVYEDLPMNSTFAELEAILPWQLWLVQNPWAKDMRQPWNSNFSQCYVQLKEGLTFEGVSKKIKQAKAVNQSAEENRYKWEVFVHPMSKWNLFNEFKDGRNTGGKIKYVWLFAIIGVFVLMLACINFMNLATARSEKRAREVGVRKAVGSSRGALIRQFFTESYVVVLLAFVLAIIISSLMLPLFNEAAGTTHMVLPWKSPLFWLGCIVFIVITGLFAGSYPALYLSSLNPVSVLKGTFKAGRYAAVPRRILVVLQFTVSVMLIIGTIVVYQQIQHAKDRPIGYQRKGLVNLNMEKELQEHFEAIRSQLINDEAIVEMAASNSPLTQVWNSNGGFDWEGKDPNLGVDFPNNRVSYEFGKTAQWEILAGRDFSREFATDSAAFVINQAAAKFIGFEDPVGKTLRWENEPFTIIGVVSDVMQESPFYPVRPTLYHIGRYDNMYNVILRLHPDHSVKSSLAKVEALWKKYLPTVPFAPTFVDERFAEKFEDEERIGKLSFYFAILAIFISCLGLFGMASFVAEQRVKEIGVRKVLGASVTNLWAMLSKEFVWLIIISCAIAIPIAWYYLHNWLLDYDYRISIEWYVFVIAVLLALVITLATVSFQAIKAALANPTKSLRLE